jgi:hypothetical protein
MRCTEYAGIDKTNIITSVSNRDTSGCKGYLAVCPLHEGESAARPRRWLVANNEATLFLAQDKQSLELSIYVQGHRYVRSLLGTFRDDGTLYPIHPNRQPRLLSPQQTCSCWCIIGMTSSARFRLANF